MTPREDMLTIVFYDGEYDGDMAPLVHICEIEGRVVPHGGARFPLLEEVSMLLEMSADKYSVPQPLSDCFTVFVGHRIGSEIQSVARLDILAHNGSAGASIVSVDSPRVDTESVPYTVDDDVVTIACKVLEGGVCANDDSPSSPEEAAPTLDNSVGARGLLSGA
jgi:hypothetical protein